jgi:4,5-dihydroxyphthalate decarboxylase
MSDLRLKTAIQSLGHTAALIDGSVAPRGFAFEFEQVTPIIKAFRRMVRGSEFDISEMAITTYLCARANGKRLTALPIFLVRAFHHGAIRHNTTLGIRHPKDLEGKLVGVNRGYTVTTGVWARAVLQHEYGVDLSKITWVLSGDEHVAEFQPPANVLPIEAGKELDQMLAAGEIAAAIGVAVEHPDVKPLIANATAAGLAALQARGYYPINHLVVVREELLEAHPGLALDIFNAFFEAKRLYVERLKNDQLAEPTAADQLYRRVLGICGADPLPYGIAPNRRMLEALIGYAAEQGIIGHRFTVDELFARRTHDLIG